MAKNRRKAKRMSRPKARRKTARRPKPDPRKTRKTARRRPVVRKARRKAAARRVPPRKPVRKTVRRKAAKKAARRVAAAPPKPISSRPRTTERPALDRSRRVLPDEERLELASAEIQAVEGPDRMLSAARSGHDELRSELLRHTETSPELTAGDVDAHWQDAYAIGDEAPGGDNPTPDQGRVDDIGKALGIEYRDDEELQGGEEVTERDHHRWEKE